MAFHLLLRAGARKRSSGALDQVIGLPPRPAQSRRIGFHAPLANKAVRVQAAVEGHNLDGEALLGEQGNRLFGRIAAGGVGIEVHHHLRGVPLQNRHLLLGKGRAAGGDHVLNAAQVDTRCSPSGPPPAGQTHAGGWRLRLVQLNSTRPFWNRAASPAS
jgi:hypothetical protein